MQCHLEGKVAIERPGRHAYEFQPGEDLSDYMRYYVLAGSTAGRLGGVSQVEALTQSIASGSQGTRCRAPVVTIRTMSPQLKNVLPTTAKNAWRATEHTLPQG